MDLKEFEYVLAINEDKSFSKAAKRLFISQPSLSQYINHKRILLVRELHTQGQSLLEASTNAGFNNYSHFYRQYVKKTGMTPKNMN